jgi:hypothetical protein
MSKDAEIKFEVPENATDEEYEAAKTAAINKKVDGDIDNILKGLNI